MSRKKERLILALDLGGSMTKIIGGVSFAQRDVFGMEPQVIELPKEFLESGWFSDQECDRAWVEVFDKSYAVGSLACALANANPMLSRPKSELALPKTLAALWLMKERFTLSNHLRLFLCCLLPPGERKDGEKLKEQLQQVAPGFQTPSGQITFVLEEFRCKAEGSGIFMLHRCKRTSEALRRTGVAVVMLGYRNISTMVFERNNLVDSQTCQMGFANLIKKVVQQTSSQNLSRLAPAVANYLETNCDKALQDILVSGEPSELEQLKKAIALAKKGYEIEVGNWLKEVLPSHVQEVVLGGGTVDTLRAEIFEMLAAKKLYLHADVELPDDIKALKLGNRFGDLWCIWDYFLGELSKLNRIKKTA